MEPITTIASAIQAGHHITTVLKSVAETLKASGKSETLSELIDAQMTMLDLVQKHQSVILQNGELREQVKKLEETLAITGEVERRGDAVFLKADAAHREPYCMHCWGNARKLVPVTFTSLNCPMPCQNLPTQVGRSLTY